MVTLTDDQIEQLSKSQLHTAAKARGIKYGKLSLMQIRDALKANKDEPKKQVKVKGERKKRSGTKVEKCLAILKDNPKAERKDILKLFIKAGLTDKGASTYYQNLKNK